ncbi:hypothetical protein VOLCADRAFT_86187 [Volvox carteri f. nagariensis]|uniref:Uncharacterized protein n=1 Tax=Volvox carteri f. nagariensis TaxID=3068 RepID=D8TI41_VOLCA|nr:uncharacterized protein VOLCADRAFT_86187 [Volvox carteri f. nagariensis]EFJ53173.1 hypothetical protein VOLCADRAFT_86187 [Volvox carteri f. nagariensis]|eukprot:XP_002946178.1 hypothetical protein VOLCADRAFT_86187 [Volvox carteri f. nagariensis]
MRRCPHGSADHLYHSTYLHIDFLAHTLSNVSNAPVSLPAFPTEGSVRPTSDESAPFANSGDSAERALRRMAGEPAALIVVDPAGAIFTDPRAVRSIAAAISALHQCTNAKDPQEERQDEQLVPAAAGGDCGATAPAAGSQPLRLQLASALDGADWAPVIAAFGRAAGLLPDDPAAARIVCETILESAQHQHNALVPLLHAFCSRASFSLEAECGCCVAVGSVGPVVVVPTAADVTMNDGVGGVGVGVGDCLPPVQRHVLPGQIETAENLAMAGGSGDEDSINGDADGVGGRGHGPDSQSGITRFARDLFRGGVLPPTSPPPAVPPGDADALYLARRSRSLTESAITVSTASARQKRLPGRSSSSALAGAAPPMMPSAASGGGRGGADDGAPISGVCSSSLQPGSGASAPAPYSMRGGGALSAASFRVPITSGIIASSAAAAGCLSNTNTAAAAEARQGSTCSYMHYASAMASVASSTAGCLGSSSHLLPFAVEAARRYAALLEAVGLWATASGVLEACLCSVGECWGHRSSRMAALLTQLGRLQQMQGLYRSAEVTWRQALEALESVYGPDGVPVLQCRVALAQVLAALGEQEAETMMRGALAALDAALGPTASETLEARAAVGSYLTQNGRWSEAEVEYQALLQTMEDAPPPPPPPPLPLPQHQETLQQQHGASEILSTTVERAAVAGGVPSARGLRQGCGSGGGSGGAVSSPQHRGVSRALTTTQQQQQQLLSGPGLGLSPGPTEGPNSSSAVPSSAAARPALKKSDSRCRTAWGSYPEAMGAAAPNAAASASSADTAGIASLMMPYSPGYGARATGASGVSVTFHRQVLPPLSSSADNIPSATYPITLPLSGVLAGPPPGLPLLPPLGGYNGGSVTTAAVEASPLSSSVAGGGGGGGGGHSGLGPGCAEPVAWSAAAATLADVVAAIHREYGGINELYEGMHLAGPEGSTAADLAALAAVCPRSGACIAAVVNVRRLTDAAALYDAALATRRAVLSAAHPVMIDLQLQYARYLSSAGEYGRAETVCRVALEQLMFKPPPGPPLWRQGAGSESADGDSAGGGDGRVGRHPAEVRVRQTLGVVLAAAGSLAAATAQLTAAVDLAEKLVATGDMAPADARRIEALDSLSEVLWQRAQSTHAAAAAEAPPPASSSSSSIMQAGSAPFASRAVECKRQALGLTAAVRSERHESVMKGWVALGQMLEAAGDLAAAERAYECAAEVALHRHSRLSAATKAIFRQLQRVYQAQGRTADAHVLGHMYRLKGGLLSAAPPPPAAPVQAQA